METLSDILGDLKADEKIVIYNLIQKIKRDHREISKLSIIRSILNNEIDENGSSALREVSSMVAPPPIKEYKGADITRLPKDFLSFSDPLDKVIMARSSKRDYTGEPMGAKELSTLLYFACGVRGYSPAYNIEKFPWRMFPSSGGLQATELYLTANKVDGLKKGLYHYNPVDHSLELMEEGSFRRKIVSTCINQEFIDNAGVVIILVCVLDRLLWKYTVRAYRYNHVDIGFVGMNIYLVGTALKLGVCAISGFLDEGINQILRFDDKGKEFAALLMSVGKLRE